MDDEESWLYGGGGEEDQAGGGEAQNENPDSGSKDVQEVRRYNQVKDVFSSLTQVYCCDPQLELQRSILIYITLSQSLKNRAILSFFKKKYIKVQSNSVINNTVITNTRL